MRNNAPKYVMYEENDPIEMAAARVRQEKYDLNYDWLQANAAEVFRHRGKYYCIAGQELFVGDDIVEILARAKAAHPDDDGRFTGYIPKERAARIYAC